MRRIPRSRAFYVLAATVYAVVVFVVIGFLFTAELSNAGVLSLPRDPGEVLRASWSLHVVSFFLFLAFSLIAALVAYRLAAAVTAALTVEERRARELAIASRLATTLSEAREERAIAETAVAALHEALDPRTSVGLISFDLPADAFSVFADEGPRAGELGEGRHPLSALPDGIRTQVVTDRRPLVLTDTAVDDPEWLALVQHFPSLASARTFALMPLVGEGRLLAALVLRDERPAALGSGRVELVNLLGHTVAAAIEGARSLTDAEARAERESLVNRIAQRARASLDPNEVLRRAVEDLGRSMRTSRALVALGTTPDDLRVAQEWVADEVTALGIGSQFVPTARVAVRESRTVVVHDLEQDARLRREPDHLELLRIGTRAVIATPIGMRGQVVGALIVSLVGRARTWTGEEVRLVESVANELRVAMETARLFQQRQRESERMLALHHASAVLAGQTDPRVVLEEILQNAVRLVGKGSGSLYVWVPEAKVLRNVRDHLVPPDGAARALRSGEGMGGVAFERMAPYIVNDYQAWAGANLKAHAAGQRAGLAVPLIRSGEPIGALVVRSYDATVRFTEEDGHLLTLFADLAVAALTAAEAFEQQRASVQELERLSRAKSDFISIVSHEFRTPLTGIQGFSEMIRDEDLSAAEVKDYANDINRDALRLNRMINDMLDLDRMESGRMQLNREPLDLNQIITDVVDHARPNAPEHPMVLMLDRRIPPVSGDRDKLTQVITNLLSNAVKYSPNGGEVAIVTRLDGAYVHVSVRDHGLGIPENALEKVFERYSRVESGDTRHIQGTGLGLPIVRQIVGMHGGQAWVESTLGEGSDFQFTLPLAAVPEAV